MKRLNGDHKYRDMVHTAVDGICMLRDQVITYANPQLCKMLDADADRLVGTSFTDYLAPEERERTMGLYRRMTTREAFPQRYETVLLSLSGARLDVAVTANMATIEGAPSVVVMVHDISGLKKARQMAIENERLEAVRSMARGVGNNFANILSVISSYAVSIADSFLPHSRPHESATKILDAARHATELTKRLMGVLRVNTDMSGVRVEPVSVISTVQKACDLMAPTLKEKGITLDSRLGAPDTYGLADAGQLLDVLMNVLLNAVDATPPGGTVSVSIPEPKRTDDFMEVSIRDTGLGMSPEQVKKAFEPFFTTHSGRSAFGLGLPVSQSMVKSWGGRMELTSKPGVGTCVMILIPASEPPLSDVAERTDHRRTVLVVDAREDRRQRIRTVLEADGHMVMEAHDGVDAISRFREQSDAIDLTVLDWMMPGVDGREVLQVIHGHDPDARVLMMSGFSRDYVRSQIRMGAWSFLQKPFSDVQLRESVRKTLGLALTE